MMSYKNLLIRRYSSTFLAGELLKVAALATLLPFAVCEGANGVGGTLRLVGLEAKSKKMKRLNIVVVNFNFNFNFNFFSEI